MEQYGTPNKEANQCRGENRDTESEKTSNLVCNVSQICGIFYVFLMHSFSHLLKGILRGLNEIIGEVTWDKGSNDTERL